MPCGVVAPTQPGDIEGLIVVRVVRVHVLFGPTVFARLANKISAEDGASDSFMRCSAFGVFDLPSALPGQQLAGLHSEALRRLSVTDRHVIR